MTRKFTSGGIFLLCVLGVANLAITQTNAAKQAGKLESFVGISPCNVMEKQALQIPLEPPCDRVTWKIDFYYTASGVPDKFNLKREWGYHIDNRTYQAKGVASFQGTWRIVKGRKQNPNAETYFLYFNSGKDTLSLLKISNSLLHVLDHKQNLMVGDGGQSYTLSKSKSS